MAQFTRSSSNLIGTPASPASVGVSASATGTLTLGSGNTVADGTIGGAVIISASLPTSSPTVQFSFTMDGTNYINDGGSYVVPITSAGTFYYGPYVPPDGAIGAQVVVTNGTGNAITAWFQGATESVV